MFAKIIFGARGSLIVKIVIIINNFGLCCAYFSNNFFNSDIFGKTCNSLVEALLSDGDSKDNFFTNNYHNFFYILIIFFLMSFLIFKESIESLKKASFVGVLGITVFFFSFIFMFIYKSTQGLIPELDPIYLKPNGTILQIFSSLPTVFLAFTFQFNVFPIYLSLKDHSQEGMMKSTIMGVTFCVIIYLITGIIGLLSYGTEIKGSILDLLKLDIIKYKNNDKIILATVIIINIAFLISSTMSIPLMFFSLKKNFINTIIFCKKKLKNKNSNSSSGSTSSSQFDENILKTVDNEKSRLNDFHEEKKVPIENKSKNIIIVLLYCSITACTILIPGLDTVNFIKLFF